MAPKKPGLFRPPKKPSLRDPCPCLPSTRSGCRNRTVVYVAAGSECPHCHLATLREEPGGEIRCPVCGYGTHRPVT